jgi:tetratricopeptide (TPR) repeat protein
VGTTLPTDGVFSRLAQNYHVIPQYLGLLLFPVDLTLFHKVPQGGLFNPPWFLPAWLLLLAGVYLTIRSRNRVALFCLSWGAINYAPISNIVPIPSDPITERFLYMPAVGFFIVLGVLFSWIHTTGRSKPALWGITAIVVTACAVLTIQRNLDWKNDLALFSSGARNDPMSPAAHFNLGTAYRENNDLQSASREWEKTLAIDPKYADALTQMGTMAAVQGDLLAAEKYYLAALEAPQGRSDPDKSMAHYNLGKIYEKRQEPQLALQHYRRFLETVPLPYVGYKDEVELRIARLLTVLPLVPAK